MKLKDAYVSYQAREDETLVVATGAEAKKFKGLLRANEAASFILKCLAQDTTEQEILEAMKNEYNAPEPVLKEDLDRILELLRAVGAIEE